MQSDVNRGSLGKNVHDRCKCLPSRQKLFQTLYQTLLDSIVPSLSVAMAAQSSLPHRGTGMSDDAVPDTDPSDVRLPLCGLLCVLNAVSP